MDTTKLVRCCGISETTGPMYFTLEVPTPIASLINVLEELIRTKEQVRTPLN